MSSTALTDCVCLKNKTVVDCFGIYIYVQLGLTNLLLWYQFFCDDSMYRFTLPV